MKHSSYLFLLNFSLVIFHDITTLLPSLLLLQYHGSDAFPPIGGSRLGSSSYYHHLHHPSPSQQQLQQQRILSTKRFFQNGVDPNGKGGDEVTRGRSNGIPPVISPFRSSSPPPPPISSSTKIRRTYETFLWNYQGTTYNINYRQEGSILNPPILFIHGFGANIGHFRYQFNSSLSSCSNLLLQEQEESYCLYAIDLLGFGASDKPNKDSNVHFSIELFGDLIHDFINEMGQQRQEQIRGLIDDEEATPIVEQQAPPIPGIPTTPALSSLSRAASRRTKNNSNQWVLVGNSMGGLCSLQAASIQQLKERIRGVELLNCAPGMSVFRYEDIPLFLRPFLLCFQKVILNQNLGLGHFYFSKFKTRETVETILTTMGVYTNTTNVDEELLELLLEPSNDVGSENVFLNVFGGPPGPTPESLLSQLHDGCKVLCISGKNDPWLPPDKGCHRPTQFYKFMKRPHTNFQLHILDCGHCPQDEVPHLVNQHLSTWLKESFPKS